MKNGTIIEEITKELDKMLSGTDYYNAGNLLRMSASAAEYAMYIITSTRSNGKTSYFTMYNCMMFKKFKKNVCYLVRQVNELSNYDMVFSDIIDRYNFGLDLKSKTIITNVLSAVYCEGEVFAYVANLRKIDTLKKYSSLFADTELILIEEYQIEEGRMLRREPELLKSVIRTVGRGHGEMVREVLTVLLGNPVTLLNPYLVYFGIAPRYRGKDGIIKNGKVAAQFSLANKASELAAQSSVTDLFKNTDYDIGKSFLYAGDGFLAKPPGKTKYLFTVTVGQTRIGIREDTRELKCYCTKSADPSCSVNMVLSVDDMEENAVLMKRYTYSWKYLESRFTAGKLFYQTMEIKEIMFDLLGVSRYN